MVSIKETEIYSDVLKELNYPFGTIFIFKGFVVSEINKGISFSWENHAKKVVEDISMFLGTNGNDLVYISNRVNSYSVVPSDWLKFIKNTYALQEYCIVSDKETTKLSWLVENLFFNKKIKRFNCIYTAINWVHNRLDEVA
ncbi:hypothetical protein GCM10022291_19060 [Postechiella marina]|uniref:STAS/SEC14 domain-containing protein n=1 Tax=Postechiella marina TaxID=943941 RepID=A0ABP8C951_9FLAO